MTQNEKQEIKKREKYYYSMYQTFKYRYEKEESEKEKEEFYNTMMSYFNKWHAIYDLMVALKIS